MNNIIKKILPGDSNAQSGIVWNTISLGIIGISGLILNILIGSIYDASVLGIFNLVLAFYIVLGQVGVWGMQNASVYYVSVNRDDKVTLKTILGSFMVGCGFTALLTSLILLIFAKPLSMIVFKSETLFFGLLVLVPTVFFFSINKLFLGFINGLRYMRVFAILQSLRYVFVMVFILGCIVLKIPGGYTVYSLLFAELLLFLISGSILLKHVFPARPKLVYLKRGLVFGSKSVFGGVVGELNTKADILVLGIFLSDSIVGIYSFASILAEGFYSLIMVFRTNLNPLFAKYYAKNEFSEFALLQRQVVKKVLPIALICAIIISASYSLLCELIIPDIYKEAMIPLIIILGCMTMASPFIARGNMLSQCGRPELDTIITTGAVVVNLIFNFIMIPHWGMIGAAVATGFSYVAYSIGMKYFFCRYLNMI